jgi:glutamine phosphoribosylpyrophosphate amidotransferase
MTRIAQIVVLNLPFHVQKGVISEKYQKMIDLIAQDLGVTTLRYQTLDDMVDAIGIPQDKLCTYCWTGRCPKSACSHSAIDIVEIRDQSKKSKSAAAHPKLWK